MILDYYLEDTTNILTFKNFIKMCDDKNKVKCFINKISNLIPKLNYKNILKVIKKEKNKDLIDSSLLTTHVNVYSNLTYDIDILKLIPTDCIINYLKDEVYLYYQNEKYTIPLTTYKNIIKDDKLYIERDIDEIDKLNIYYDKKLICINENCKFVSLSLYSLFKLNVNIDKADINNDDYVIITANVVEDFIDLFLSLIPDGYYITDNRTEKHVWLPKSVIEDMLDRPLDEIKHNRIRKFINDLRQLVKKEERRSNRFGHIFLTYFVDRLTREWEDNNLLSELEDDFPYFRTRFDMFTATFKRFIMVIKKEDLKFFKCETDNYYCEDINVIIDKLNNQLSDLWLQERLDKSLNTKIDDFLEKWK